jgi:hypothetical protein
VLDDPMRADVYARLIDVLDGPDDLFVEALDAAAAHHLDRTDIDRRLEFAWELDLHSPFVRGVTGGLTRIGLL